MDGSREELTKASSDQGFVYQQQSLISTCVGQKGKYHRWISRRGSYNSIDHCVSCTTFNILAPIYKRLSSESCRESEFRECWLSRNQSILDMLLQVKSSIICLQEFWVVNEELVGMYEKRLGDAGYTTHKLARTNNRGDGLLIAVHRDHFQVLNYRELLFNDSGDRVAQLLHVELVIPLLQTRTNNIEQQALVVNTHLLFPHDSTCCLARLHQVYKILQYVESYQIEHQLQPVPIILCGDWNGSKRGQVYKFLRSQGFVSSYDTAHHYTDSDADAHKWVSHRNHRGNICGVDFIWLLNPDKHRKPLKTSWKDAVFGIIKNRLHEASLDGEDVFCFLETDVSCDNCITYSRFSRALTRLGLTGHPRGLNDEEIHDLWVQVDTDGDEKIYYLEFQRTWEPPFEEMEDENEELDVMEEMLPCNLKFAAAIGFDVKNAVLFPPEVEKGMWPENYSLSDHAHLTVEFSPVRMHYSQAIC